MAGFSKLEREERYHRLMQMGLLSKADVQHLKNRDSLPFDLAEHFIENVIGYMQVPMGVVTHLVIDGRSRVVPMAVEETSIIAAASKTAKWIRDHGTIQTSVRGQLIIGQVQVPHVADFEKFQALVVENKNHLVDLLNSEVASGLVARGGGVRDITARRVPRAGRLDDRAGEAMAVVHIYADPCDAMGANIMNQMCEYLKGPLEKLTGEKVLLCILSNLVDSKVTTAKIRMIGVDRDLAEKICEASLFAQQDPYRAATNNKGILNGIDPILIATGNDWRAVEAGLHAYAARDGQYRSLSRWYLSGPELVGEFEGPVVVGVVGGVTKLHPTAQVALRLLEATSAEDLSRVCAAVGLVQNLGALRALSTVGIIEGHMKLHIRNLSLGAGAQETEMPMLQRRLEEILALRRRISLKNAVEVLTEMRQAPRETSPFK
jgi:hydroxymethylglutaryl-CoA reductase